MNLKVLSLDSRDMKRLNWNILEEEVIFGSGETLTWFVINGRTSRQKCLTDANGHLFPQRKWGICTCVVGGWGSTPGKGQWDTLDRLGLTAEASSVSEAPFMSDSPQEALRMSMLAGFPNVWGLLYLMAMGPIFYLSLFILSRGVDGYIYYLNCFYRRVKKESYFTL